MKNRLPKVWANRAWWQNYSLVMQARTIGAAALETCSAVARGSVDPVTAAADLSQSIRIYCAGMSMAYGRCFMDAVVHAAFAANEPDAGGAELPRSWAAPVRAWFDEAERYLGDKELQDSELLDTIAGAVADLADAIDEMDVDALADVFERGMGQAALAGALASKGAKILTTKGTKGEAALAAKDDVNRAIAEYGIVAAPLEEAVKKLGRKSPVSAKLSSEEWALVPLHLRERAQFSAHVESVRFLTVVQNKVGKRLAMEREQLANGLQAFVDRDSFIRDMRQIAIEEGIETTGPEGKGTVRDIHSVKRLGMIYDMQTQSAQSFARRKMDLDPDVLDQFPAYRLTESIANEPRTIEFWKARWNQAGSETSWTGAAKAPFVALKTSPIWARLSRFGTPWAPFDFGSTRDLEDVDRAAAEGYGLLEPGADVPTHGADPDFNDGLEASAAELTDEGRAWLAEKLGDAVDVTQETVRWTSKASAATPRAAGAAPAAPARQATAPRPTPQQKVATPRPTPQQKAATPRPTPAARPSQQTAPTPRSFDDVSKKAFEDATKPLRKKLSFGDQVVWLRNGRVMSGVINGADNGSGLEVILPDGSKVRVPKAELRMPQGGARSRDT